jgi:hypothetical protein
MGFEYSFGSYKKWIETNEVCFERKLQHETAFDGIVKIFSLKTNSIAVNNLLDKKFFGEFEYIIKQGVFLRMFDNKNSWPKTRLVFLDIEKNLFIEIQKTDSSWDTWTGNDLGDGNYAIEVSPGENIRFQIK